MVALAQSSVQWILSREVENFLSGIWGMQLSPSFLQVVLIASFRVLMESISIALRPLPNGMR